MKYKILKTDGTSETIVSDRKLTLDQMQAVVGGLIEYFEHNGETFVCNEEGIILGLPRNPHFIDRFIFGEVIVLK